MDGRIAIWWALVACLVVTGWSIPHGRHGPALKRLSRCATAKQMKVTSCDLFGPHSALCRDSAAAIHKACDKEHHDHLATVKFERGKPHEPGARCEHLMQQHDAKCGKLGSSDSARCSKLVRHLLLHCSNNQGAAEREQKERDALTGYTEYDRWTSHLALKISGMACLLLSEQLSMLYPTGLPTQDPFLRMMIHSGDSLHDDHIEGGHVYLLPGVGLSYTDQHFLCAAFVGRLFEMKRKLQEFDHSARALDESLGQNPDDGEIPSDALHLVHGHMQNFTALSRTLHLSDPSAVLDWNKKSSPWRTAEKTQRKADISALKVLPVALLTQHEDLVNRLALQSSRRYWHITRRLHWRAELI